MTPNIILYQRNLLFQCLVYLEPRFFVHCPFVEAQLDSMTGHILFQPGGALVLYFSSLFDKSYLQTYFWFKPLNQTYGQILIQIEATFS